MPVRRCQTPTFARGALGQGARRVRAVCDVRPEEHRHALLPGPGARACRAHRPGTSPRIANALRIDRDRCRQSAWLARLDLRAGRIDDAEHAAAAVLESYPDHADALLIAGMSAQRGGRAADARRYLERALALAEHYVDVHIALGILDFSEGHVPDARRHFERAVQLEPARRAEVAVWLERTGSESLMRIALTRALVAVFWLATALYALLSAIPFASQQFLEPQLMPAVTAFAAWHQWLSLAALGIAAAGLAPWLRARDRGASARSSDAGRRSAC